MEYKYVRIQGKENSYVTKYPKGGIQPLLESDKR